MHDHAWLGLLLLRLAIFLPAGLLYQLIRQDIRKDPPPHDDGR
jgi:hypothetical protein